MGYIDLDEAIKWEGDKRLIQVVKKVNERERGVQGEIVKVKA